MFHITDSARSYFHSDEKLLYLHCGLDRAIFRRIWIRKMVTVSMPVYHRKLNPENFRSYRAWCLIIKALIFWFYRKVSHKKLIQNPPCHKSNLTECDIDQLRKTSCDVSGCSSSGSMTFCADPQKIYSLNQLKKVTIYVVDYQLDCW